MDVVLIIAFIVAVILGIGTLMFGGTDDYDDPRRF